MERCNRSISRLTADFLCTVRSITENTYNKIDIRAVWMWAVRMFRSSWSIIGGTVGTIPMFKCPVIAHAIWAAFEIFWRGHEQGNSQAIELHQLVGHDRIGNVYNCLNKKNVENY